MTRPRMSGVRIVRVVLLIISVVFAIKFGLRGLHTQQITSRQPVPPASDNLVDGMTAHEKLGEQVEQPKVAQPAKDSGLVKIHYGSDLPLHQSPDLKPLQPNESSK